MRALNAQFASWASRNQRDNADKLWDSGLRDYLKVCTYACTFVCTFEQEKKSVFPFETVLLIGMYVFLLLKIVLLPLYVCGFTSKTVFAAKARFYY